MKKILYLHIGYPKTGTTTIQKYLSATTEELKEQGYLYPKTGRHNFSHHEYPWVLTKDSRYRGNATIEELMGNLKSEFDSSGCDKCVISSEAFVFHKNIQEVKSLFSGIFDEIKIIIGLRNPLGWIYSDYNQGVKARRSMTITFDEYLGSLLNDRNSPINYERQINRWSKVFCMESIQMLIFPSNPENLIKEFAAIIDISCGDHFIHEMKHRQNVSVGFNNLEFCRGLNFLNFDFKKKNELLEVIVKQAETIKPYLSEQNKIEIVKIHYKFCNRFNILANPIEQELAEYSKRQLDNEAVRELARKILVELAKQNLNEHVKVTI